MGSKVSAVELEQIRQLVAAGVYLNTSDFARDAILDKLSAIKTIKYRDLDYDTAKKEVMGYFQDGTAADIDRAVRAARAAFPAWRATSWPPWNSASVGMLRMLKRAARFGWSSVLTFTSRTCGSSCTAACSKAGAIMRQGPHHGAQKSTSTGIWLRAMWRSNPASSSASGAPVNSGWWQLPQSGALERSVVLTRFVVWQGEIGARLQLRSIRSTRGRRVHWQRRNRWSHPPSRNKPWRWASRARRSGI